MKTKLTLAFLRVSFVLLALSTIGYSQDHTTCGTEVTPESLEYFNRIKNDIERLEDEFIQQRLLGRSSTALTAIPIKAHIIRPSSGIGGLSEADLNDAIAIMNGYYSNAGLEFFLCDGINYIDSDTYFDYETSEENAMTSVHNVANLINIYFANSVTSTSSGNGLCGYAYFPGGPETILMANACATNGSTLSHEMGHFFALYHTHGTSNSTLTTELVDGTNCGNSGDFICDTPADPQLGYGNVDPSCNYTGTAVDANLDPFQPNPNNIMSYSRKECRTEFSAQQYARINAVYNVSRNNLLCPSFNANFAADVTESCDADLTVNFTDSSVGATSWSWDVDGDDIEDYNTQNVTHTYTSTGRFDVTLTISNGSETISRVLYEYIRIGAREMSTTEVDLVLTLDDWPAETTWQFLDSDNNVLYSGGPYIEGVDDFTTKNETFAVNPDVCYSFVINDSYGDGICCASGSGSYQLIADDDSILASGGDFAAGTRNNFFNSTLSVSEFSLETVSLFPNPAKESITLKIGNQRNVPDAYQIYNVLGQSVMQQDISGSTDLDINISTLTSGVYFIKLTKETSSKTLRFVKQ